MPRAIEMPILRSFFGVSLPFETPPTLDFQRFIRSSIQQYLSSLAFSRHCEAIVKGTRNFSQPEKGYYPFLKFPGPSGSSMSGFCHKFCRLAKFPPKPTSFAFFLSRGFTPGNNMPLLRSFLEAFCRNSLIIYPSRSRLTNRASPERKSNVSSP